MAVNKVDYFGESLIDITDSTTTTANLLQGEIGYSKSGDRVVGQLIVQKYYTGSTAPSASLGINGDIYLKV